MFLLNSTSVDAGAILDEDQAQDYAKRKGWDEREMVKWLGVTMK